MFTGLVECVGSIKSIVPTTEFAGFSFTIAEAKSILTDCAIGDSIAVSGVCLTVTAFDLTEGTFVVGLANETLARSNLGKLVVGSKVNLERAMAGHGRFGGHFVQGHVDTIATILSVIPDGDSIRYTFGIAIEFYNSLIPKGYVALDGTSLTLTQLTRNPAPTSSAPNGLQPGQGLLGVMLVAHTQEHTILAKKVVGDTVNVECDVVGKGVESVVRNVLDGGEEGGPLAKMIESIVERVLTQKGLLK